MIGSAIDTVGTQMYGGTTLGLGDDVDDQRGFTDKVIGVEHELIANAAGPVVKRGIFPFW